MASLFETVNREVKATNGIYWAQCAAHTVNLSSCVFLSIWGGGFLEGGFSGLPATQYSLNMGNGLQGWSVICLLSMGLCLCAFAFAFFNCLVCKGARCNNAYSWAVPGNGYILSFCDFCFKLWYSKAATISLNYALFQCSYVCKLLCIYGSNKLEQ